MGHCLKGEVCNLTEVAAQFRNRSEIERVMINLPDPEDAFLYSTHVVDGKKIFYVVLFCECIGDDASNYICGLMFKRGKFIESDEKRQKIVAFAVRKLKEEFFEYGGSLQDPTYVVN